MFIGRERETKQVITSLSSGRSVILSGKYGIGRTSLVRHVARVMRGKWNFLFADFSRTPDQVCRELEGQLKQETIYKKQAAPVRYKSRRRRLAAAASKERIPSVLVLDNIAKLTAQKLTLIRYWAMESSFLFVAVTETFIAETELLSLRMVLLPADIMHIKRMQMGESVEMIRSCVEGCNLSWTDQQVRAAALVTRGYPLGIVELISGSGRTAGSHRRVAAPEETSDE
jgi:hypothetical protein